MPSAVSHKIDDYESLLVALQDILGVVVPDEQRSHLVERIEPLLSAYKLESLADLAEKLQNEDSDVRTDILDVISLRQSSWIINPEIKHVLHNYILGQLPEKARIWIVGCGQGQLAYSIAMEVANFEQKSGEARDFEIVATDLLSVNIKQAESATYSSQQLMTLHSGFKNLYMIMDSKGEMAQVKKAIRQSIQFSVCDLTTDIPNIGAMDLIICPDALVYFSNGVRAGIVQQFTDSLNSGGILLTGHSQIVPVGTGLEQVVHTEGIFYRQKS